MAFDRAYRFAVGLSVLLFAGAAQAQVRITEWMYSGGGGEFVELTNVGGEAVSLVGWSYDDDSATPGVFDLSGFGEVQPGESVVFTESDAETFRSDWGLCAGVKILGGVTNNLGRNDQINIFDAGDAPADVLTYGDQDFPGSIRTQDASGWVSATGLGADDVHEWTLSTAGDGENSSTSSGGAIGSPGKSTRATVPYEPCEPGGPGMPPGAVTLSAGGSGFTCWIPHGTAAFCWGRDGDGQLGNGPDISGNQLVASPVDPSVLPPGTTWASMSTGHDHACGVTGDGTAYCWGADGSGRLGDGPPSGSSGEQQSPSPVDMSELPPDTPWQVLSAGDSHTCGLTGDGAAYCWGADSRGQLGNGPDLIGSQVSPSPVDVSGLPGGEDTRWVTLTSGEDHTCGLTTTGQAYCWGSDADGWLGNGPDLTDNQVSPSPVDVAGLPDGEETFWIALTAGYTQTCGLTAAGAAYCWGTDTSGQLGNGPDVTGTEVSPSPVDVSALPDGDGTSWASLSAGRWHTCGVTVAGAAYCWGSDASGRLGNGPGLTDNQVSPSAVDVSVLPPATTWASLSASYDHTCGLTTDGAAYCWGDGGQGRLGTGNTDSQASPALVDTSTIPAPGDPEISIDQTVVVGSIGDPTNPTALLTLDHPSADPEDLVVTVDSTNGVVLPAGNVTVVGTGGERVVAFDPVGRGTSSVTFTMTDPDDNQASVTVAYAASNQAPDPPGRYHHRISDASSALDVGDGTMLLVNDETNTIFLHHQEISGLPVKTWTFTPGELGTSSEIDFESIARRGDLVVLSGSHGNNRSGETRPERRTFIGATITGFGAGTELAFLGRYNGLWADLRSWDAEDGHGLGANFLGFVAGTAPDVQPNPPNGFNIEALEFSPDEATLYLGFRAPTIEIEGRYHALIVPVLNVDDLVDGVPATGPAELGAPIFLDLDGRSIRELRRNDNHEYLISAGPSPQNGTWALYTWDGDPDHQPQFNRLLPPEDFLTGGVWESIVAVPPGLEEGALVRVVTDSGDTNFYGTGQTKDLPQPYQKSYSQLFALEGSGTEPTLTVALDGTGQGTVTGDGIDCPGDCTEVYVGGAEVTLVATAEAGSSFAGFGGDCSGTEPCVLTMDADKTVTATFTRDFAPGIHITEWMYSGPGGEFVELTNTGDTPVSLADWSYDDDSATPGVFDLSGFGEVQPGESVVFTESDAEAFRGEWGLCAGVKILGGYTNNLGRNDQINIFDAGDALVDRLTYGDQTFPGSIRTQNASGWVSEAGLGADDVFEWTLSTAGDGEGSSTSAGGALGSPGRSTRATVPYDPCDGGSGTPTIAIDQSVVVGSIGDPTNPGALLTVSDPDHPVEELAITVASANGDVLPAANVTIVGNGEERIVGFEPVGRGTSSVTFTVTDPDENEAAITMTYASSNQAPDPSGRYHHHISDASAALDVGDGYMLLVNDETNTTFLHHQEISGLPVKTWTFTPGELGTDDEIDFEGLARWGDLLVITGSHGNNRSGAARPERRTFVVATITGSGAGTEVTFLGRYNGLWDDLRTWDTEDGHGLGADFLGFIAGTAPGVEPNPPDGFNIEALEFASDGAALYLGFRAPTIEIDGAFHALIVPVLNVDEIVDGVPAPGPALFGAPVFLDLDGRSIRALRANEHGEYLIVGGPSPQNETWALYTWDGDPASAARFNRPLPDTDLLTGGAWEGLAFVPHPLEAGAEARVVADSGDANFYGTGQTKDLPQPYQKSYSQLFALEALAYDLTITLEGSGEGMVSGDGIACPDDCEETYLEGTEVTLTAAPETGFVFTGWGGDCAGTGDCMLTLDADKAVTATFVVAASLAFEPSGLDFGDVTVDSTASLAATLQNIGGVAATGLSVAINPPDNGFDADISACGDTLPAGGSCEVGVTFTPAEAGAAAATLQVSGLEGTSAPLALAGNGLPGGDGFTPMALEVDPEAFFSDGNEVLELGELVEVAPAWRSEELIATPLSGTASQFGGTDGGLYFLGYEDADYGMVEPGATASCRDMELCYYLGVEAPNGRPATHWTASFEETLSDETVKTWELHIGDSFTDVPRTSPFYPAIETLLHQGVTGGCTATEYCPAGGNSRGQMAVFLLKAAEGGDYAPAACVEGDERFGDVPFDSPLCPWIEELASRQVTSGCGGGNYCPGDVVSRAQMAVFLLKAAEGGSYTPPECSGEFSDVECSSTFAAWVEELAARGVTGGCAADPPAYCPAPPVTRAQMAVFVTKTFGLTLYGP